MNNLAWLKTYQAAASDVAGEAEFVSDLSHGDTTVHLPYDGEVRTPATPTIRVRVLRLDDLVARGEIRAPDFIKIDVEGHGHHALGGALESIRRTRPVMLMGFHSPQEVAGTESLLRPLGYEFIPTGSKNPAHRVGADYLLQPARA
jgi:FkbM family methyltransferase